MKIWQPDELLFDAGYSGKRTYYVICSECGQRSREPSPAERVRKLTRHDVSHARTPPSCPLTRLRTMRDEDYQKAVFGPAFVLFLLARELDGKEPTFMGVSLDAIRTAYPPREHPEVYSAR